MNRLSQGAAGVLSDARPLLIHSLEACPALVLKRDSGDQVRFSGCVAYLASCAACPSGLVHCLGNLSDNRKHSSSHGDPCVKGRFRPFNPVRGTEGVV